MCANHACLITVPIGIIYILWDNQKYVRTLGTVPHASKWKNRCIFRGLVLKFQYKVCHMSAHHVCLINMLFGYIFKLLCSIKVCAPMWHILSSLNPIFLYFFGQNAIFAQKNLTLLPQWQMISRSQNSMFWLVYDLPVPEPDTYDIEERFKICCLIIKWLDDKRHRILCLVMIFFWKVAFFYDCATWHTILLYHYDD